MVWTIAGLIVLASTAAVAATIEVSSNADAAADDGLCTLREAINSANTDMVSGSMSGECSAGSGSDEIVFDAGVSGVIALASSLPNTLGSITITGPGPAALAIDGSALPAGDRMLTAGQLGLSNLVEISGLTFRNGPGGALTLGPVTVISDCVFEDNQAVEGGAIRALRDLTVESSVFRRNVATNFEGGAIQINANDRLIVIRDSLFEMNEAQGAFRSGGALQVGGTGHVTEITGSTFALNKVTGGGDGGAISLAGDALSIINSTFSANEADRAGGAIEAQALDNVLHNVTLIGNRADADDNGSGNGGGIAQPNTSRPVTIRTSIIAGNFDESGEAPDCAGQFTTGGYNLIGAAGGTCGGFQNGTLGDQVGTLAAPLDPQLASLSDNGGPTDTHLPLAGSPLIDAGDPSGCTDADGGSLNVDQRGQPRPTDGDGDGTPRCDIGAVETAAVQAFILDVFVSTGGSIQSTPAGIDCPGDCSQAYADGTVVELTPVADAGSAFDGWSGDCSGTGTCQVTMDQARSVTATFSQSVSPLSVQVNGDGQVTSSPAGINCPGDCSEDYAEGTVVTLSQTADPGFSFDGWSGDCSGTGACQVTMDQARSVTATFSQIVHPLSVQVSGDGQVTSSPAGINCPGDCSEDYAQGTVVTLSRSADPGFAFDGWSGDCTGTGTCQITMDQARSVQATFEPATVSYSVDVEIEGNGIGMVESTPAGIDCPGDCSASFESGELITLNPIPGGSSTFFGWRADCAPAGTGACQILVDQTYRVIAIFGNGDFLFHDGFE